MRIETVEYRLTEKGPWEPGILIDEGNGPLLTLEGKIIKEPIWDWTPIHIALLTIQNWLPVKRKGKK